jgi:4-amino-4-deoxy-L-arabinose transferase-like glycosyltransferase
MEQPATHSDGPVRRALAAAVAYAERAPGRVLTAILAIHLVVWTVMPMLVSRNLQLDLAEDLALGKEWQLGYWKHPPLPWWVADALYRATGQIDAVYLLGPFAAVLCLWGVYLLARDIVGPLQALIAVLALEGIHFYNFSVVKFAHDQMQLPFWAFTALFFHRALTRGRLADWGLAGACLAGAFWSKYAAVVLAVTLAAVLLIDPVARRAWRSAGPWLMAAVFAGVIAPNAWWLIDNGFMPLAYADARARVATHWYHYILYPLLWTESQLFFLLPAIALLALLYVGRKPARPAAAMSERAAFDRRYVTALALGPFAVTTLVAAVFGRLPVSIWGYPLWSFAPLAAVTWLGPVRDPRRLRWFAAGFLFAFAAFPLAYAAIELFEPFVHDRAKATQFPGAAVATAITTAWHDQYGTPLAYVCGTEFDANTLAVYSPDRPRVVVHCDPKLSPWIDLADVRRRGIAVVFDKVLIDPATVDQWRATFGPFDLAPPLHMPRQTLRLVRPVEVTYGFVAPRP